MWVCACTRKQAFNNPAVALFPWWEWDANKLASHSHLGNWLQEDYWPVHLDYWAWWGFDVGNKFPLKSTSPSRISLLTSIIDLMGDYWVWWCLSFAQHQHSIITHHLNIEVKLDFEGYPSYSMDTLLTHLHLKTTHSLTHDLMGLDYWCKHQYPLTWCHVFTHTWASNMQIDIELNINIMTSFFGLISIIDLHILLTHTISPSWDDIVLSPMSLHMHIDLDDEWDVIMSEQAHSMTSHSHPHLVTGSQYHGEWLGDWYKWASSLSISQSLTMILCSWLDIISADHR